MSEESEDDSQKTEDPTQKRLEESRKKEQVPVSREVNNWIMLMAATILIGSTSVPMMSALKDHLKVYLEHAHDLPQVPGGIPVLINASLIKVLGIMFLPMVGLMAAAFIGPFVQVGPLFSPETIKPDLSKISVVKGWERIFSKRALVELLKGVLKIMLVGFVGYMILKPYFSGIEHEVGMPVELLMGDLKHLILRLMTGVLVVLTVLAGVDVVYQRVSHYQKMRMTKQEIKEEYKQSEGDPHVRGRLRQLRAEKARQRMMQAVPRADVVITNPTHFSIALEYKPDKMDAPVCIAKGTDDLAMRIREEAKKHNILLYPAPPLARALYDTVEVDEAIPPEHFKAVAEVISYVFKLKGKIR